MLNPSAVDPMISLLLNVSSNHAVVGHKIQYNLTVFNKSDTTIDDAIIVDTLSPCLRFINGSVNIDSEECKHENINSGIKIGQIYPKQSKLVSFLVEVISSKDECNAINTDITVFYNHDTNGKSSIFTGKAISDPLTINIYENNIHISKKTSPDFASLNDIVKYTVYIENTSDLDVYDVLLEDNSPNSTSLINGTFKVNGTVIENVNLNFGVNLGNLGDGQSITVEYQVRVLTANCNGTIESTSSTTYNYFLPNGYIGSHISYSNIVNIKINMNYSRDYEFDNSICLPKTCPDIDHIYWINGDLEILNWEPLNLIRCSTINGVKILVSGNIVYSFGYSTLNSDKELRVEDIEVPFKGTLILLCNYTKNNNINISGSVTDVKYQSSDNRCILCKTSVELVANI